MNKLINYDILRNKKVLITGGLGFVGHNLVKTLLHQYNCEIILVDDCSNSNPDILGDLLKKVRFYPVSVLDKQAMAPLLTEANFVFHLACKQISASSSDPFGHLAVNGQSTLEIMEFLRHNNLPHFERFVYTSSCSVYGSSTRLPSREDSPKNILSNYSATKLLGEHFVEVYFKNYGLPVSVVRYSNVYGYGQTPNNPYCGVMGKFIHNALEGKPLTIFGDGEQTRDYTFITDAVDATILAAIHPMALGEVFNIGTSSETSVTRLAELIGELIPDIQVQYVPERDIDNVRRRSIDIEKIHQRLGWTPRTTIRKGIAETVNWYRNAHFAKSKLG
jgi:UDP-glucose 4-epimerase